MLALQPQLSMLSISVQPDILALFLITAGLYFALKFVNEFELRDLYLFHLTRVWIDVAIESFHQ